MTGKPTLRSGEPAKRGKGRPKKIPAKKGASNSLSSPATEESDAVPNGDSVNPSLTCCLPSTPKRGTRQTRQTQGVSLTSTPVRSSSAEKLSNISESPPGEKLAELQYTEVIPPFKASELDSPCCKSKAQNKCRRGLASQPRQLRKRVVKKQMQTCSKADSPPAKRQRGKTRKIETKTLETDTSTKRSRPRFELKKSDASDREETLLSSDLSIELSHHEEQLPSLPFQDDESVEEEEEEEEEDELPSFLMQMDKKPLSITEGAFVWHKIRNYPFWPALVKRVNRKQKKASVVFIDSPLIHKKKGFSVALKMLKPFECESADELVCTAKEQYAAAIEWSMELIKDYRIRIACGSFCGSFIDYFAHDMSYPVRRKYPQADSERLTITSDSLLEESFEALDDGSDQQEEVSKSSKRLLPDRTHAAHNRANEKLVHFIVKQRSVEERLLAVIRGQQQSTWLRSFLSTRRRAVVNVYLEDEEQLDQVYCYLKDLYMTETATAPCLVEVKSMERVPFVLDVLLPEAIIYAIAGVDKVTVKRAEEKYLKGRCVSKRERQEFEVMIERQMRTKSQH